MATITLSVEHAGVDAAAETMARLMGQLDWVTATAMSRAGRASKRRIAAEIFPLLEGGPTGWTQRGLITTPATPQTLEVQAGFRLGQGRFTDDVTTPGAGGTPAGRYLTTNVRGGTRRMKSSEAQLYRKGLIDADQRLIPVDGTDARGNLSGAKWKQIKNEVIKNTGGQRITPSMTRKQRRNVQKSRSPFFVLRMNGGKILNRYSAGGEPVMIAKRTGKDARGFMGAMLITDRPSYKRRFNVENGAYDEFTKVFKKEFEDGVIKEMKRRRFVV